jgi:GNAT superfamily N-acetyltransferase
MLKECVDKRIRIYRKQDKDEILGFTKDMYAPGFVSFLLNFHEKHRKRTVPFIFEEKGEMRAICFFHRSNEEDGWLMGMRVKRKFQRSGIATVFTRELESYARKQGLSWLGLNTSFKNRSVHGICKRLGFERNEAYYTYVFDPKILKRLKQTNRITLERVEDIDTAERYLKRRRIKRYLFVVDPGYIWIRLRQNTIKELINLQGLHFYNGKLLALQRWGEFLTFNFFGGHGFVEHVDLLSQLYREYPDPSKGRIAYCVRKREAKGIDQLYGEIATAKAVKKEYVEKSDWYLYSKFL